MDLEEAQEILEAIRVGFEDVKNNLGFITDGLSQFPGFINKGVNSFDNLGSSADRAKDRINATGAQVQELGKDFEFLHSTSFKFWQQLLSGSKESADSVGELHGMLLAAGGAVGASILPISDAFKTMGQQATISGGMIDENITNALSNVLGLRFPAKMLEHAQSVKNVENSILSLRGKSGDLGTLYEKIGGDLSRLNEITNAYADRLQNVGDATGLLSSEVGKYATQLFKIQGAYDAIAETPSGEIDLLTAAITTARGTTQEFSDVFEVMNMKFRDFGDVSEDSLRLMSNMFNVAQSLGLPFEYVSSQVSRVSEQLRNMGDNTEGALRILGGLAPALDRSGVGPEGIKQIVGGLTDAVGQLDIAQKAFISAQTGGPGGLQGAFQMDLMLREGNIDEVFRKMQQTLMQQFGEIVTLKDAAQDPMAAQQLTRQMQFLRQGPFNQLAKTDADAYRILEAFQQGATPTLPDGERVEDQFGTTLERGQALQERQHSTLITISNSVQRIQSAVSEINAKTIRENFGNQLPPQGSIENISQAKLNIDQARERAMMPIKQTPEQIGANIVADTAGKIKNLTDIFRDIKSNKDDNTNQINIPQPQIITPQFTPAPINVNLPERIRPEITSPEINARNNRQQDVAVIQQRQPIQQMTQQDNTTKEDSLTIFVKSDNDVNKRKVAEIIGQIKRIEKDEAAIGTRTIDVGY